ncbi:hypothetical protein KPL78_03275 [Roseomonas sp. HJA6]|uniref:Uncharacterized protein n=1 Tax=Roseomonas alba TaxID=2846776 RepID=A0ABS7A3M1_9PROT|nr:hypothetical protein [Neoroseomonas alba]MBW6396850.1 hypothetical protein [Neoroseomonas alba]
METRTTRELVELRQPFSVKSRIGKLPPGQYMIELHEERFDGLSFPDWRRSSMTIADADPRHGERQDASPLTPSELADLLNADLEP